jgi:two-component system NarL family sensor kinase
VAVGVGWWKQTGPAYRGTPGLAVPNAVDAQVALDPLPRAREEELRRWQQDLHDGIGPLIAGARMLAKGARDSRDTATARVLIAELDESLAEAALEIRRVVNGLCPPALEHGLPVALGNLLRRHRSGLAATGGLAVGLDWAGELTGLPAAVEVTIYRLVDEALTNVARHAKASHCRVEIRRQADLVRVIVDDDGIGGVPGRSPGVGLSSMRQRCVEFGGSFEVLDRQPGTRLLGLIPLPPKPPMAETYPPCGAGAGGDDS